MLLSCSKDRGARIDALFTEYHKEGVPGASVAVIQDGEVIFKKGYGLANLEEKIPVTTSTNFRLASVTKQFTAMCIMILTEQGKLGFDDDLTRFFPKFPDYGKKITVRHLLQHTSGLIAYEDLIPDSATMQVKDRDVLEMMMQQDSTYFEPGSQYRYSNSGYAVLAMIVEKVSGLSFATFLQKYIFEPLQMHNTVAYEKGMATVAHRAYGYTESENGFEFTDQSMTSAVLGDGGIYSSVEELYKWDQALYTEKLVSKAMLEQAFTSGVLTKDEGVYYGFGWRLDSHRGRRRVYHGGSTRGFRTAYQRFPDDHFSVIVLINRNDANPLQIATQIVDLYLPEKRP
jgi:CubicO group peptidase (beta-lactamase class C family)